MSVQDDARENELIKLFGLKQHDGHKRGDPDAFLLLDGKEILFELKSTTKGSVTTARDFSTKHIKKWKGKHWLIGFYDSKGKQLQYSCYLSPEQMLPWIESMEL